MLSNIRAGISLMAASLASMASVSLPGAPNSANSLPPKPKAKKKKARRLRFRVRDTSRYMPSQCSQDGARARRQRQADKIAARIAWAAALPNDARFLNAGQLRRAFNRHLSATA